MSLLTNQEIHDADPAPHERFDQERIDFARAVEQAVLRKLAAVSTEPVMFAPPSRDALFDGSDAHLLNDAGDAFEPDNAMYTAKSAE